MAALYYQYVFILFFPYKRAVCVVSDFAVFVLASQKTFETLDFHGRDLSAADCGIKMSRYYGG